jgi:energy-coupling factor transport system ATP-binding protein
MIELEHVSVSYGAHLALDDINLRVEDGEFVLLAGPSGCGKSTLARCLNGVVPRVIPACVRGRISVDGGEVTHFSPGEMAASVGLVYKNPVAQFCNMQVEEEVAFGARNLGLPAAAVRARTERALDLIGLVSLRNRSIRALSGGEQQRLAIASALALEPRLLVLDEPLASLDATSTRDVMTMLSRLNSEQGITILVIEHRLAEVAQCAGRVVLMDRGRVVADGTPGRVLAEQALMQRLGLRTERPGLYEGWSGPLGPIGRPLRAPLVELADVEAGYGSRAVLRGLNLTLHEGEFVALVGDNGAGKTTLARVLAGQIKPQHGRVHWGSGHLDEPQRLVSGAQVGLLLQNSLDELLWNTVEEEVALGVHNPTAGGATELDELFRAADLAELRQRFAWGLSSGQQQRTALAALLASRPSLIILDEPTVGQDWHHLTRLMDYVARLNQRGCTVLLITHDRSLVRRYARRVVVLREGQIVADGSRRTQRATAPEKRPQLQPV